MAPYPNLLIVRTWKFDNEWIPLVDSWAPPWVRGEPNIMEEGAKFVAKG